MEWFALAIPMILGLIASRIWKHRLHWLEIIIPVAIAAIVIGIMKYAMVQSLTSDTEYLSEYVVRAEYYEDWDEWIKKTCSYTTCTGTGKNRRCTTHHYDCS